MRGEAFARPGVERRGPLRGHREARRVGVARGVALAEGFERVEVRGDGRGLPAAEERAEGRLAAGVEHAAGPRDAGVLSGEAEGALEHRGEGGVGRAPELVEDAAERAVEGLALGGGGGEGHRIATNVAASARRRVGGCARSRRATRGRRRSVRRCGA